jgi:hypothetical protein
VQNHAQSLIISEGNESQIPCEGAQHDGVSDVVEHQRDEIVLEDVFIEGRSEWRGM